MEEIILKRIRKLLVDLELISEDDLLEISDEDLLKNSFEKDLELDSLDYLLLIEKLDDTHCLSVPENEVWDCQTVQELLIKIQKNKL